MSESNKSYRIRTKVGDENTDKFINVSISQDYNTIELLSLKIDTANFYRLRTSKYGCIAGRVLANGGVGIPNAKISVFIPVDNETKGDPVLSELYPFTTSFEKNSDGVRYNLFPDTEVKLCHTKIGTFPDKRLALDDEKFSTIYNKYYTYTTRTNNSGDYMIFGVPVGNQSVHTDIDLSDIGFLSQKPIDMMYKGFNATQFENPKKFKSDVNLDSLAQVISQNDSVYVYPFWGDDSDNQVKITRNDVDVQYKFEPSCVFIGSLVTDDNSNGIQKNCIATEKMGKMDGLTAGYGTIEMIRKTIDGNIEEFTIQGNQLIDGNGTWCYQIPMNLDYFMTDEYGNMVPSDNKDKGIPTRTRVRFRVSLGNFNSDETGIQVTKMLIPNNPKEETDLDYHFGSMTYDDKFGTKSFRDLFWNNVYTVKSYIPRIQKGNFDKNKSFTGFKQVNVNGDNNPIPYNNMRIDVSYEFTVQCALMNALIQLTSFFNKFGVFNLFSKNCTVLGDGLCPDLENWYFAPGCDDSRLSSTINMISIEKDPKSIDSENQEEKEGSSFCVTNKIDYLLKCVEMNLAMESGVIQFDFYNDWINGLVYIPKWYVNIKRKKTYLNGNIPTESRIEGCMESSFRNVRRYVQQCSLSYSQDSNGLYTKIASPIGCKSDSIQACHTGYGRNHVDIFGENGGLIHNESSMSSGYVYYAKPAEWMKSIKGNNKRCPLFATDIVLLGSMNSFDENGIPNTFNSLIPTTYKLPPNLASTNMDKAGNMYGITLYDKGARCKGRNYIPKPLEELEQTEEQYKEWSKNTSYYDDNDLDIIEPMVTTSAGIDWGYNGPGQGDSSLSDVYYPGGHFLGLSCANSETNIKSCVNLSRICEIGTTVSERHTLVTEKDGNLTYVNIVPSGLINKYDITDSDFRKIFASMNHNGLKTKTSSETSYLEYDIKPMVINMFNGEMSKYINAIDGYYTGFQREEATSGNVSLAFHSTIEVTDKDYYKFRLGINEDSYDASDRYLIYDGQKVALPMYENSFYFYFGLKDGSTALDRFFRDYHAKCDTMDNDYSYVTVTTTPSISCIRDDDEDYGTATITINDVDAPYTMALLKDDPSNYNDISMRFGSFKETSGGVSINVIDSATTEDGNEEVSHNYNTFTLTHLLSGTYKFIIAAEGAGSATISFKIYEESPDFIKNAKVMATDFVQGFYSIDEADLVDRTPVESGSTYTYEKGGYISIKNVSGDGIIGIIVHNIDKYIILKRFGYSVTYLYNIAVNKLGMLLDGMEPIYAYDDWCKTIDGVDNYYIPAWRGNTAYNVVYMFECGESNYSKEDISGMYINMESPFDLYYGDSDCTFYNTIYPLYGKDFDYRDIGMYEQLLTGSTEYFNNRVGWSEIMVEKKKWNLKHSLYYRKTMYSIDGNGSINVYAANGVKPYENSLSGKSEGVIYNTSTESGVTSYRYNIKYDKDNINDYRCVEVEEDALKSFGVPTAFFNESGKLKLFHYHAYKGFSLKEFTVTDTWAIKLALGLASYNSFKIPDLIISLPSGDSVNPTKYVPVPIYTYQVKDSSGSTIPITGSTQNRIGLPSIYRPSYFYAVKKFYRDEQGTIGTWHTSISLVNPILYKGKTGQIVVDGEDVTEYFNDKISHHENKPGYVYPENYNPTSGTCVYSEFEDINHVLSCRDVRISEYGNDTESLSVSVADAAPDGYNGNIITETLSDSITCKFPSKDDATFSSNVRFYSCSGDTTELFFNGYARKDAFPVFDGCLSNTLCWNGIFGATDLSLETRTADINLRDVTGEITEAIYSSDNSTKTPWERFEECVKDICGYSDEDSPETCWVRVRVIAICDKWTTEACSNERNIPNIYEKITPDENIVCLARVYECDENKKLV